MSEQAVDFAGSVFSNPAWRRGRLARILFDNCRITDELNILEIGCSTGEELFALADLMPMASLTGVDISKPNINEAKKKCRQLDLAGRVDFYPLDYLQHQPAPCDAIISDGTFHLMPTPAKELFTKINGDLKPGGILIFSLPKACLYNKCLMVIRRIFRLLRSSLTDRFILWAGKRLHAGDLSHDMLRERVHYMYVIPNKYLSTRFIKDLEVTYGWHSIESYDLPHTSIAQPKHMISIFRKPKGYEPKEKVSDKQIAP